MNLYSLHLAMRDKGFSRHTVLDFFLKRFPDGAYVFDSHGGWRDPDTGETVRGLSYRVDLALTPDSEARVQKACQEWCAAEDQGSVMVTINGGNPYFVERAPKNPNLCPHCQGTVQALVESVVNLDKDGDEVGEVHREYKSVFCPACSEEVRLG